MDEYKPDIVVVSETWLTPDVSNCEFSLKDITFLGRIDLMDMVEYYWLAATRSPIRN